MPKKDTRIPLASAVSQTSRFFEKSMHGDLPCRTQWTGSMGNRHHLEGETSEIVFIVAGPEFDELDGHTLVMIFKALCGLRSGGLRWSEKFSSHL
jgi:hypothetical protein